MHNFAVTTPPNIGRDPQIQKIKNKNNAGFVYTWVLDFYRLGRFYLDNRMISCDKHSILFNQMQEIDWYITVDAKYLCLRSFWCTLDLEIDSVLCVCSLAALCCCCLLDACFWGKPIGTSSAPNSIANVGMFLGWYIFWLIVLINKFLTDLTFSNS